MSNLYNDVVTGAKNAWEAITTQPKITGNDTCEYCNSHGIDQRGNCASCGAPFPASPRGGYKMVMACTSAGEPIGPVFEQIDLNEL